MPCILSKSLSVDEAVKIIRKAITEGSSVEIKTDHEELTALLKDLLDIHDFTLALSNGDMSKKLKVKGRMPGALKSLQAHLQHMTWQTMQVADGDFTQRVDFMGDFSEAFNTMTLQLEEGRAKLLASERRYRQMAIVDPLTGAYNRRHFFDMALMEFSRSERKGRSLSILMIDADHFKQINDSHGHAAGDAVLCAIPEVIERSMRKEDTLARYGGEEFIILCPETTKEEAALLAERIRSNIEKMEIPAEGITIKITVSIGVSQYVGTGGASHVEAGILDKTIDHADTALYEAKNRGRNQVHVFTDNP